MAGAQVAISALPASTTIATTDVLGFVFSGTTKKLTAGNLRNQIFAFAATDPLNCGILTAVGNSTITGTLSGITTLTASTLTVGAVTSGAINGQTIANPAVFTGAVTGLIFKAGTNPSTSGFYNLPYQGGVSWRNSTNTANLDIISQSTDTRLAVSLGLNINGDALKFGATNSKVIPGTTSISLRDANDANDNLKVFDNGNTTVRGTLNVGINATTTASLNMAPSAGPPSVTLHDGDMWTQTTGLFVRISAATKTVMLQATSTGYTAFTNTINRATAYDTTTVTLPQLASRVAAMQADLTTQNILGP